MKDEFKTFFKSVLPWLVLVVVFLGWGAKITLDGLYAAYNGPRGYACVPFTGDGKPVWVHLEPGWYEAHLLLPCDANGKPVKVDAKITLSVSRHLDEPFLRYKDVSLNDSALKPIDHGDGVHGTAIGPLTNYCSSRLSFVDDPYMVDIPKAYHLVKIEAGIEYSDNSQKPKDDIYFIMFGTSNP